MEPVLDTTSDGRKRRAHTRLIVRHVSLVSRAGNTVGEGTKSRKRKGKEKLGGRVSRSSPGVERKGNMNGH